LHDFINRASCIRQVVDFELLTDLFEVELFANYGKILTGFIDRCYDIMLVKPLQIFSGSYIYAEGIIIPYPDFVRSFCCFFFPYRNNLVNPKAERVVVLIELFGQAAAVSLQPVS
jgi:hypothetical protein